MKRDLGKIVDILYGFGLIFVFAGTAAWIKGIFTFLVPFVSFGALMLVVGAGLSLFNQFKK